MTVNAVSHSLKRSVLIGALALVAVFTASTAQAHALSYTAAHDAAERFAGEVCGGSANLCDRGYSAHPCSPTSSDSYVCRLNYLSADGPVLIHCVQSVLVTGSNQDPHIHFIEGSTQCMRSTPHTKLPFLSKPRAATVTRRFARSNLDQGDRAKIDRCARRSRGVVVCTFEVRLNSGERCRGGRMKVALTGHPPRISSHYVSGSIHCRTPAGPTGHAPPDDPGIGGGRFEIGEEVTEIRRFGQRTAQVALIPTSWIGNEIADASEGVVVTSEVLGCQQTTGTTIECVLVFKSKEGGECTLPVHWNLLNAVWHSTYSQAELTCKPGV
jgi:hypothetical protein